MSKPVVWTMPGGTLARGYASDDIDLEAVTVFHEMGDGSIATEVVWRAVQPPVPASPPPVTPQPAPAAAAETPDNAP